MMRGLRFGLSGNLLAGTVLLGMGCAPASAPSLLPSPGASAPEVAAPSSVPSTVPSAISSVAATSHRLLGAVVDIDRVPLTEATVTVRQGDRVVEMAKTGIDGTYSFSLPSGAYEVTASRVGLTTRTRKAALSQDLTLNFGPTPDDQANPFFLADTPEVERVEVQEEAPGGPLTLRVHLSEPITAGAQKAFDSHFEFKSGRSVEFLTSRPGGGSRLKTSSAWEEDGKVYVFSYPGPYVASGPDEVVYTVSLEQEQLDTTNSETQERNFEDLGIVDAAGHSLGRGRAAFAFVKPEIFPPSLEQLVDRAWGFLAQDRRWRLSHDAAFTFTARRDEAPPALVRVDLEVDATVGTRNMDILTLRFNKPMSAAKNRNQLHFTRLSIDRPFVILNVAADAAGKDMKPVQETLKPREMIFDFNDASILYLHYPANFFDKQKVLEVTLTPEALDPAGNKPDPANNRLTGPIF